MLFTEQDIYLHYIDNVRLEGEDLIYVIREINPEWTHHTFKKLSMTVDRDVKVEVNGVELLIKKDFGFNVDYFDPKIYSFKILESGVNIYALVAY